MHRLALRIVAQLTLVMLMNELPRPEPEAPAAPVVPNTFFKATSAPELPWSKNVPVLIAALAFFLSLLTSLISAYAAYKKDVHDRQAELSAVVEKLLQIPVSRASLSSSIKEGGIASLEQVFAEQNRMLTLEGYNLALRLGSDAAAPELMNIAAMLTAFENYRAAKQIYRQATLVADNFADEVTALRTFGLTMIRFAQIDRERSEGEQAFEQAMNIGSKYPDVARNPAEISYAHALTQTAWTDAWSGFDCNKAEFHLQQADKFEQAATGGQFGPPLQPMTKAWHEALLHCDESGRLPFEWRPGGTASSVSLPNRSDQPTPPTVSQQLPPAPLAPRPARK